MKLKTTKGIKISLLVITGIIFLGGIGGAVYTRNTKQTIEEEKSIYTYEIDGKSDYVVNLNPNILYGQVSQKEGETYLSAFINNIGSSLKYRVTGNKELQWQGEYRIEADLRGFTKEKDSKKIIWSKTDILVPKKIINIMAEEVVIAEEIAVDFNKYNSFAEQVIEDSKVSGSIELEIRLIGNLSTAVGREKLNLPIHVSVNIPMQTPHFDIEEIGEGIQSQQVMETYTTELPPNKKMLIGYIAVAVVGGLGFIISLVGIKTQTAIEQWKKLRDQIKKEHGSRMVAISGDGVLEVENIYQLTSIEDLVKLADELQRPIFYPAIQENIKEVYFYVEGKEKYYMYRISAEENQGMQPELKEQNQNVEM